MFARDSGRYMPDLNQFEAAFARDLGRIYLTSPLHSGFHQTQRFHQCFNGATVTSSTASPGKHVASEGWDLLGEDGRLPQRDSRVGEQQASCSAEEAL